MSRAINVVTDEGDDVLARYRARNGAVLIEGRRAGAHGREPVDLVVVDSPVGQQRHSGTGRVLWCRGRESEVLAALCAHRGGASASLVSSPKPSPPLAPRLPATFAGHPQYPQWSDACPQTRAVRSAPCPRASSRLAEIVERMP